MTAPVLDRVDTHFVGGNPDPFSQPGHFLPSLLNAFLATAFFRSWYLMLFFTIWSTAICAIIQWKQDISIQSTLLTVFGTVLGFVISYRTSSSFERYNEGRKFWSSIILASRTFARSVWFHVPDNAAGSGSTPEEIKARTLIEKKTVLNLLEAFAVGVKHYLRGEEGTYYVDLHHLVGFLPAYALPAGLPTSPYRGPVELNDELQPLPQDALGLPMPATSPGSLKQRPNITISPPEKRSEDQPRGKRNSPYPRTPVVGSGSGPNRPILLPARNPPKTSIYDIFPFSMLVHVLTKKGKDVGGKKAQRERAKMGRGSSGGVVSHNIPLEISLYLSSYIAALQTRKVCDVPTINLLIGALNNLVDSLTGLERILTTPIPFSYSMHLWTVTWVYCIFLPFQLWKTMGWVTVPGTVIAAFIFFGFIVAGEEIENPFGFDRNDLNMDHFTHNIIRVELQALTALPVPDPAQWAFAPDNHVFADDETANNDPAGEATPEDWVKQGVTGIEKKLAEQTVPGRASQDAIARRNGGPAPPGHPHSGPTDPSDGPADD